MSDNFQKNGAPTFKALDVTDESLFAGKPWRVMCFVVAPDGSTTGTSHTHYSATQDEAESFIWALSEDDERVSKDYAREHGAVFPGDV